MDRRKSLGSIVVTAFILCLGSFTSRAADQSHETDIRAVLHSYEEALNNSDVEKVMRLYAKDGVFMPSNKPTATGYFQVKKAYQHVFEDLDLAVKFHIAEIMTRDDLAIVRTVSDGEITLLKKNKTIKNSSRELFIMKRERRHWEIYRYMFNETGRQ